MTFFTKKSGSQLPLALVKVNIRRHSGKNSNSKVSKTYSIRKSSGVKPQINIRHQSQLYGSRNKLRAGQLPILGCQPTLSTAGSESSIIHSHPSLAGSGGQSASRCGEPVWEIFCSAALQGADQLCLCSSFFLTTRTA